MSSFVNTAPVKWAQRKDSLYITISLSDVKDHKIDLASNRLTFSGRSGDKQYSVELVFFKDLDTEGSIWNVLPQSIQMKLMKKEKDEEFWPRLLQGLLLFRYLFTLNNFSN
jgi:prostaglandin-E synthase